MSLQGTIIDARELLALLGECERLIGGQVAKTPQIKETQFTAYQTYIIMRRLLASMQRMGLPEDASAAIADLQRLIMTVHTLSMAIALLESTSTMSILKGATALLAAGTMMFNVSMSGERHQRL